MNCPYARSDCKARSTNESSACAECRHRVQSCVRCDTHNRALANFCRECGAGLAAAPGNWCGYKGGPRRLGLNTAGAAERVSSAARFAVTTTALDLQLGSPCRHLLGYGGQLIAIAENGTVAIVDPSRPAAIQRYQTAPPACEPCIDRGVLYVASAGQVAAYSLGSTTLSAAHLRLLWQLAIAGTPIRALTAVGDRLYVTVVDRGGKELEVLDRIHDGSAPARRSLFASPQLGWIAADPSTERVVFLSEDETGVQLHTIEEGTALKSRQLPLQKLAPQPIALNGESVFVVAGEQQRLYRVDLRDGSVDSMQPDTQSFSLHFRREGDWERDVVRIESDGIVFGGSGSRDTFSQHDRASHGSPVLMRGRAAAVALRDRILVYDLVNPPTHHVWRLHHRGADDPVVTALASFDHFIVAGNHAGTVEAMALPARMEVAQ